MNNLNDITQITAKRTAVYESDRERFAKRIDEILDDPETSEEMKLDLIKHCIREGIKIRGIK